MEFNPRKYTYDEPDTYVPSYANFLRPVDKETWIFNLFGRAIVSSLLALLALTVGLKLAPLFGI